VAREEGGDRHVLRRGERRDGSARGAAALCALQRDRGGGAPLPARFLRLAAAELLRVRVRVRVRLGVGVGVRLRLRLRLRLRVRVIGFGSQGSGHRVRVIGFGS